ncbi:hypothetical protein HY970_02640 [Candidatus Kaiserbacteria bacterium]|nr:hypothetical protein [Candidatus Kaiserbacteria bacterium]
MVKDYFQDIIPPQGPRKVPIRAQHAPTPSDDERVDASKEIEDEEAPKERSIRNIAAPARRARLDDMRSAPQYSIAPPRPPHGSRRKWLWIIASICVVLVSILLLVALRSTSVTVIPRSHPILFDQSSQLIAYPSINAATGTLSYRVEHFELVDTEAIPSSGSVHAEERASVTLTIYNEYSVSPVRLVKTTRFETPGGLVFRAPADIIVPAKTAKSPGKVDVTVIADKPGAEYNVEATRFTLPGFKGKAEYTKVYAQSASTATGGFSGERPGVAESDMNAALAKIRGRLEQKARESAAALNSDSAITFTDLTQISYLPTETSSEAGGGARIHEKASVLVPVFSASEFASAVARSVAADTDGASVRFLRGDDLEAHLSSASSTLGSQPLQFTLTGHGLIVWNVDSGALAQALAGRDQGAFQTVVNGFASVQSARARIEPFWSSTFPTSASDIKITVNAPSL